MRGRTQTRSAALGALLVAALSVGAAAAAQATGTIRGRVSVGVEGASVAKVGAIAVYLAPAQGPADFPAPGKALTIEQKNARFVPGFSIVTAGQQIRFPNRDGILHNVFSFSKPNDFELGLYPAGESRTIRLKHAGIVRVYCSIHESMRAVVLVSPTPWYALSDAAGAFEISGVPPGKYQITTFNEPLPSATRNVKVVAGESSFVEIAIGVEK